MRSEALVVARGLIGVPRQAIAEGADYLVIGRPITNATDTTPRKAAERISVDMQAAFDALRQLA